jgi:hypothetical protein
MITILLIVLLVTIYAAFNYIIYDLIEKEDLKEYKSHAYIYTFISWCGTTFGVYILIAKEFNL